MRNEELEWLRDADRPPAKQVMLTPLQTAAVAVLAVIGALAIATTVVAALAFDGQTPVVAALRERFAAAAVLKGELYVAGNGSVAVDPATVLAAVAANATAAAGPMTRVQVSLVRETGAVTVATSGAPLELASVELWSLCFSPITSAMEHCAAPGAEAAAAMHAVAVTAAATGKVFFVRLV